MLLGDALRLIMGCTGTKQLQLASFLGYDVSYINRWINTSRLPATHNTQSLISKIASYLSCQADDKTCGKIFEVFDLQEPIEKDELTNWIYETLSACEFKISTPKQLTSSQDVQIDRNCIFTSYRNNIQPFAEYANNAIRAQSLNPKIAQISIYSSPKLSDFNFGESKEFWRKLQEYNTCKKKICVSFVFHTELTEYMSSIYSDIFTLYTMLPDPIEATVYAADSGAETARGVWLLKGSHCTMTFPDLISGKPVGILLDDERTVNEYWSIVNRELIGKIPLMKRAVLNTPSCKTFFQNFFLCKQFTSIHTVMPFVCSDLDSQYEQLNSFRDCNADFQASPLLTKRITRRYYIYRSALARFLFDGVVSVFGQECVLPQEAVIQYAEELLSQIENDVSAKYIFVNDVNPVLCSERISGSFYVSDNSCFLLPSGKKEFLYSDDCETAERFKVFIDKLDELSQDFIQSGAALRDIILGAIKHTH